MFDSAAPRITPWVGRLLAINAVVLLLQQTLFTSPAVYDILQFSPTIAFQRPWTFVTYMFVHGGLMHLLGNSLALFVFGPTVERRMGSTPFLAYYLYCGIGSAIMALALTVLGVSLAAVPFVGASGAILGVAFAFARFVPDAELLIFPLPVPIKARTLVWVLVALDVGGMFLLPGDGIAHVAHLGGIGAGWLYFVARGIARPNDTPALPSFSPRAPVTVAVDDSARRRRATASAPAPVAPAREPTPAPPTDLLGAEAREIDRLLDKMSASGGGLDALTPDERRFLDTVARRRRTDEPH